jgi:hypothetical protein
MLQSIEEIVTNLASESWGKPHRRGKIRLDINTGKRTATGHPRPGQLLLQ